jgi:hypothetical protein
MPNLCENFDFFFWLMLWLDVWLTKFLTADICLYDLYGPGLDCVLHRFTTVYMCFFHKFVSLFQNF